MDREALLQLVTQNNGDLLAVPIGLKTGVNPLRVACRRTVRGVHENPVGQLFVDVPLIREREIRVIAGHVASACSRAGNTHAVDTRDFRFHMAKAEFNVIALFVQRAIGQAAAVNPASGCGGCRQGDNPDYRCDFFHGRSSPN